MRSTKAARPEATPTPLLEKRREPRLPGDGEVWLLLEDLGPVEIEGRLLDYSTGGFRAAHRNQLLRAGQDVRFRHFRAHGRARVIWNRILPRRVETGFLILE